MDAMDPKTLSTQLLLCILFSVPAVSSQGDASCVGRCGEGYFREHICHCDYNCMSYMECCQDYKKVCTTEASCKGRCHEGFIRGQACDCDPGCEAFGRCCSDYKATCAVQTQSPPPPETRESRPVTDERGRTPRATRKPTEESGRNEPPEDDERDPETSPSKPRPKNKKNLPENPKNNPKKKKLVRESEEEIKESEENVSSSSFSSSSSSSSVKGSKTTKKLSRKNQKKNKPGDEDDKPDDDPNQPQPDGKKGQPKKPKNPKDKGDEDNPDGTPKEPNQRPGPDGDDGKPKKPKKPKENEPDNTDDPNGKPKDSGDDLSSLSSKNTKKRSPGNGSKEPNKKPKKPNKEPTSTDDTTKPGKGKNPKNKPLPNVATKNKKKVKSEDEREETVESEFSSSSQSSSSHRRSKSSSRRLSGKKQKNINEKNKKKIPDEKPLVPPKRKKEFPPTPVPTSEEGSGDEGSGTDSFQTSLPTTTKATHFTSKPSQSTAKPAGPEDGARTSMPPKTEESVVPTDKTTTGTSQSTVPSDKHTSTNPTITSAPTTAQEDEPKESVTGTDRPRQLTSTSTSLQEQSTTAAPKSDGHSQTPNSEGLQETTTARSNLIVSTESSSGFNNDKHNATTPQMHVGSTKPSDRTDTTPGQDAPTMSVGAVTKTPSPSVETSESRLSTQVSIGNTSPTTQTKVGTTTMSPTDTTTSAATLDTQKVATTQKSDTVTLKDDNTSKVSTAESPNPTTKPPGSQQKRTAATDEPQRPTRGRPKEDLPRSTLKPKSDMERQVTPTQQTGGVRSPTTKPIYSVTPKDNSMEHQPVFTESPSTNEPHNGRSTTKSSMASYSTPTAPSKKDVTTQKPRGYVTARPLAIDELLIKNETSYPLPLDPFHICDLLKVPEKNADISITDLQRLMQFCTEMKQPVSTSPWDVQPPNPDHQAEVPPRHTITTVIEPSWNQQPPGWRIIQILEELKRRANIPQTPMLHGVPGLHTDKSTAWLWLLKKFSSSNDPQMNLCVGPPADGMTTLQNGSMVVFRGNYFWTLNQGGATERPRKISEVWGIPSPIDTVFTRCNCGGKTFFFKGPHYWRFTNDIMDQGYPKEIINGFGGLRGKITAVLSVAGVKTRPESVFFFKNGGNVQKYTFRQEQSKKCAKRNRPAVQYPIYARNVQTVRYRFPRNIVRRIQIHRTFTNVNHVPLGVLHEEVSVRSTWRGVPSNIVSAVSLPNPQKQDGFDYYVFSKDKYYNINMSSKVAVKPPADAEQETTKDWYKCKE